MKKINKQILLFILLLVFTLPAFSQIGIKGGFLLSNFQSYDGYYVIDDEVISFDNMNIGFCVGPVLELRPLSFFFNSNRAIMDQAWLNIFCNRYHRFFIWAQE